MEEPLHREILEDHARSPSHQSSLERLTEESLWTSPKTGNFCSVSICSEGDRIGQIQAKAEGSALAVASASLMASSVVGLAHGDAFSLAESVIGFLEKGKEVVLPGDLVVYESIARFPKRHDCAMLAWRALLLALKP